MFGNTWDKVYAKMGGGWYTSDKVYFEREIIGLKCVEKCN